MCNDYRLEVDVSQIADDFEGIKIKLEMPEGIPNIEPRADIKITDVAPIVLSAQRGSGLLVQRRWSWPGQNGRPVYNFRSEGREFKEHRCLIIADGFYEFTTPADPKQKKKDKWLFTKMDEQLFCIAGIWREHPEVGPAFTMLTMESGPDVAPYHSRQIAVLERDRWSDWLDPSVPAKEILAPLPAGSLIVEPVGGNATSPTLL